MQYVTLILRLLGLIPQIEDAAKAEEAAKRAQKLADVPSTKQERTDAANKGDL